MVQPSRKPDRPLASGSNQSERQIRPANRDNNRQPSADHRSRKEPQAAASKIKPSAVKDQEPNKAKSVNHSSSPAKSTQEKRPSGSPSGKSRFRINRRTRRSSSSLATSLLFHVGVVVLLAWWAISQPDTKKPVGVSVTRSESEVLQLPANEMKLDELDLKQMDKSPLAQLDDSIDQSQRNEISERGQQEQRELTPALEEIAAFLPSDSAVPVTMPTGGGLDGRQGALRSALSGKRGGTPASEAAVELGLRWLLAHQFENGSWKFDHRSAPGCDGRCRNAGSVGSTTGATGLALLSFLGAGYTHRVGPHQEELQKAIDYLVSRIRTNRYGGNLAEGTMYAHAIATIALCESLSMTKDSALVVPCEQAVQYIINAQHSAGGWRYNPGQMGDLTVTGWQMMALKSAAVNGIQIPRETWQKANRFLDSMQTNSGTYGYTAPDDNHPTCTSVGMLMRMFTGRHREHASFQPGHAQIVATGPSQSDVYFNYYATQVMFHYHDSVAWPEWNATIRDFLVQSQEQQGHQRGSWYFRDKHGQEGGRLYTTCMSIMTLEVYYRYMPLYDWDRIK